MPLTVEFGNHNEREGRKMTRRRIEGEVESAPVVGATLTVAAQVAAMPEVVDAEVVMGYPKRDEILALPAPTHRPDVLKLVKLWKREVWNDARGIGEDAKTEACVRLGLAILHIYGKDDWEVVYNPLGIACCDPVGKRIILEKGSIITTMHEVAHALFGSSELKACRWSVWLFRKTFNKAYAKLVWKEHCLVKDTGDGSGIPTTADPLTDNEVMALVEADLAAATANVSAVAALAAESTTP
jgi:hypothetical protein